MNGKGRASWQGNQLRSPGWSMEREQHFLCHAEVGGGSFQGNLTV